MKKHPLAIDSDAGIWYQKRHLDPVDRGRFFTIKTRGQFDEHRLTKPARRSQMKKHPLATILNRWAPWSVAVLAATSATSAPAFAAERVVLGEELMASW